MMKPNPNLLPDELIWEGQHLSEIALGALGDGQDAIVPEKARDHAATCETCAVAMGHAAMLSSALGNAMRAPTPAAAAIEKVAVPWLAIIGALIVAALGSASSLLETSLGLMHAPISLAQEIPLTFHAASALLRGIMNGAGPVVSFGCAALLFGAGAMVARSMPRAWSSES
ncbi:MAG: hypothetical protein ABI461_08660 [Polyangiaceae bacterium]